MKDMLDVLHITRPYVTDWAMELPHDQERRCGLDPSRLLTPKYLRTAQGARLIRDRAGRLHMRLLLQRELVTLPAQRRNRWYYAAAAAAIAALPLFFR
jgi:hypothetical protein